MSSSEEVSGDAVSKSVFFQLVTRRNAGAVFDDVGSPIEPQISNFPC